MSRHIGIDSRDQNTALSSQILSELQSQKDMISTHMLAHCSLDTLVKEQAVDSTIVFRHRYSFSLPKYWKKCSGAGVELVSSANGYQSAHAFKARLSFLLSSVNGLCVVTFVSPYTGLLARFLATRRLSVLCELHLY